MILSIQSGVQVAPSGAGSPGNETYTFGPATWNAVCRFQYQYAAEILAPNNLPFCNGIFGPFTRAKANQLLEEARGKAQEILSGDNSEITQQIRKQEEEKRQFRQDVWDAMAFMPALGVTARTAQEAKATTTFVQAVSNNLRNILAALKSAPKDLIRARQHLVELRTLSKAWKIDLATLGKVANNQDDLARIKKIVDEGGDEGVRYVQEMAGRSSGIKFWMTENVPTRSLLHSWTDHFTEWRQLGLTNERQLQSVINEVIHDGRRAIQKDPRHGDQFILFKEVVFPNGKRQGVFIPTDKSGEIITAHPASAQFFENQPWFLELR